jgi:hypothetical protein
MRHLLEAGLIFAEAAQGAVVAGVMRCLVKNRSGKKIAD